MSFKRQIIIDTYSKKFLFFTWFNYRFIYFQRCVIAAFTKIYKVAFVSNHFHIIILKPFSQNNYVLFYYFDSLLDVLVDDVV